MQIQPPKNKHGVLNTSQNVQTSYKVSYIKEDAKIDFFVNRLHFKSNQHSHSHSSFIFKKNDIKIRKKSLNKENKC